MSPACLGLTYTYWEELYILVILLAVLILAPFLHLFRLLRNHRRGTADEWFEKLDKSQSSGEMNMTGGLSKGTLFIFLRDYVRLSKKDLAGLDAIMVKVRVYYSSSIPR
jgi:hypothetical protein